MKKQQLSCPLPPEEDSVNPDDSFAPLTPIQQLGPSH